MYLQDTRHRSFRFSLQATRHTTRDKAVFRDAMFHAAQDALLRMRKPDNAQEALRHYTSAQASREIALAEVTKLLSNGQRGLTRWTSTETGPMLREAASYDVDVTCIRDVMVIMSAASATHQLFVQFVTKTDPQLRGILIELETKAWFLRQSQEEHYARTGDVIHDEAQPS